MCSELQKCSSESVHHGIVVWIHNNNDYYLLLVFPMQFKAAAEEWRYVDVTQLQFAHPELRSTIIRKYEVIMSDRC